MQDSASIGADTMRKYIPEGLATHVTIQHIFIEGNNRTRRSIILREISIHEADVLPVDTLALLLNETKLHLFNAILFYDVNLYLEKVSATEINWHISVKERWSILPQVTFQLADRNFNVWWTEHNHDIHRSNIGLILSDKNFRGNMEDFAITMQVGYTQKFAINYMRPYIDHNQKHGIGFSFSVSQSQEISYATDLNKLLFFHDDQKFISQQLEGSFTYTYRPAYATTYLVQLTYKDYSIADTIRKLNPNYYLDSNRNAKLIELNTRFTLNKVDNWNYPLKGLKMVDYFVARMGIEGIKFQAFINTEIGYYSEPFPKWYVSSIFRGRFLLPESQPYAFLGGLGTKTDYVRGYEYYVADGAHYGVIRFDFKHEIFNHIFRNVPVWYLTVIPLRIYPKVFLDAGYIGNNTPGNSFLNNKWLLSEGIGLDIVTGYDIKIRLEYAFNHLGQNGLFLHMNSE